MAQATMTVRLLCGIQGDPSGDPGDIVTVDEATGLRMVTGNLAEMVQPDRIEDATAAPRENADERRVKHRR